MRGGGVDTVEFYRSSKARGHGMLAFLAAALTFLCRDKVVIRSRSDVTRSNTHCCILCSLHFVLEGLRQEQLLVWDERHIVNICVPLSWNPRAT